MSKYAWISEGPVVTVGVEAALVEDDVAEPNDDTDGDADAEETAPDENAEVKFPDVDIENEDVTVTEGVGVEESKAVDDALMETGSEENREDDTGGDEENVGTADE